MEQIDPSAVMLTKTTFRRGESVSLRVSLEYDPMSRVTVVRVKDDVSGNFASRPIRDSEMVGDEIPSSALIKGIEDMIAEIAVFNKLMGPST